MINKVAVVVMMLFLSACASSTSFRSLQSNLMLRINDSAPISVDKSVPQTYSTTSFGQYKFELTGTGAAPMYGILPLKFNGGYLAADILFFAPAAFFNLRQVYPTYQFDMKQGVVRYRNGPRGAWVSYKPSPDEAVRAKNYFERLDATPPARASAGH